MFTCRTLCVPNTFDMVCVKKQIQVYVVCEHTSVLTGNCMCKNQG